EDNRDARVDAANVLVDLQAGLVRQAQIEENDVRRPGTDPLESFSTAGGDLDPVRRRGERLAHLPREQGRVIVNEQEVGHDALPPASGGSARVVLSLARYSICWFAGRLNPAHVGWWPLGYCTMVPKRSVP